MTTPEFMEKELNKLKRNHYNAVLRNAPADNIENIKSKIAHYEKVCELLRKEDEGK